VEKDKSTMFY